MGTTDILKRVRKIEIKTRGLSSNIFAGEYHTAFKGRGMTFSEVRRYNYGDDIRQIDWNVTARFNEPYIKVFEEEPFDGSTIYMNNIDGRYHIITGTADMHTTTYYVWVYKSGCGCSSTETGRLHL